MSNEAVAIGAIRRENTEIFDQQHQMYAEGSSDEKPLISDIEAFLKSYGWMVYDVDISFDNMQGFWRWDCKIIHS